MEGVFGDTAGVEGKEVADRLPLDQHADRIDEHQAADEPGIVARSHVGADPAALAETIDGLWPSPAEALAPVASSADPVERVRFACEFLLRGVLSYQGAVRAMISGTITRPGFAPPRPGIRFGLIDYALAPFGDGPDLAQLRRDLAVVVSAEALFTLTDLCGLSPDEAVASAARTAATLTAAAFRD